MSERPCAANWVPPPDSFRVEREQHGVSTTVTNHEPQRRNSFTLGKHFPSARCAPHRQWRPPPIDEGAR